MAYETPAGMPKTMRAVQAAEPGGPEVLTLLEVPVPAIGPQDILVKVTAAGLNRADIQQRKGVYPPPPGESDILGLEVSGTVAAIGAEVTDWSVGNECVALISSGGYAEYVAVNSGQCIPPPPGVDLLTAAGVIEVAATVHSNSEIAGVAPGETYLVHGGAGGIGTFAIQYAKARGCIVWTTAGTEAKLEFCRELGADLAVSYRDDWARAFTEAGGADVILDNQGARYLMPNIGVLRLDGRLVIIGFLGGVKAQFELNKLMAKRGQVISNTLRSRPTAQKVSICQAVRETVWPMYADGRLKPVPTKVFPAEDVVAAHTYLESGEHRGKVVLRF